MPMNARLSWSLSVFLTLAASGFLPGCAPGGRDGTGGGDGSAGSGGTGGRGGSAGGHDRDGGTGTGGGSGAGGGGGGAGSGSGGSGHGGTGGGSSSTGGAGGGGASGSGGSRPDGGAAADVRSCGEETTQVPHAPKTPDVLIAFDRSASMGGKFGSGTRLSVESQLLGALLDEFQGRVRFGYIEFPIDSDRPGICPQGIIDCHSDCVAVEPALDKAAAIKAIIARAGETTGGTGTPTRDVLKRSREFYAGFMDGIRERYVLLSTDGEPTCGDTCPQVVAEVTALAGAGVKTVVLGVSEDVANSACLEMFAMTGGAPRPGAPPSYYPASDPDRLRQYLRDIIGGIAKPTCFVDLTSTPVDPKRVAVFFDGVQIPWDPMHRDGWDYAPGSTTRIVFYGSYCRNLEGFTVMAIDVRFGCPPCGGTVGC